jgi:hypothetical protein
MRPLLALIVAAVFATPSVASVLSASSETARSTSAKEPSGWSVTAYQEDLNASLQDHADASPSVGTLGGAPAVRPSGGFLIGGASSTGWQYTPYAGSALEGLFGSSEVGPDGSARGGNGNVRDPLQMGDRRGGGGDGRRGGGGHWDNDRRGGGRDGRHGGGGQGGRHGGGNRRDRDRNRPYATPEPSTWATLGAGILMLGVYAGLRRREALGR